MAFREKISAEQQAKWFDSIDNDNNKYFIIRINGEAIGLTELKKIDFEKKSAEAGIFIHDQRYLDSIFSYGISLMLLDFGFDELKLQEVVAFILDENTRAIRYNKSLGFEKITEADPNGKSLYRLRKDRYFTSVGKIRPIIDKNLSDYK